MTRGTFIAFEGGEGSGKTTQAARLAATVTALTGQKVLLTREPGGTAVGQQLRQLLLHSDGISPRAEALLFAADRAQHVAVVIRPALDGGEVVITDRFIDSSIAYQASGRGLSATYVGWLSKWATEWLVPDLTVLLDVPPAVGLARARTQAGPDRLEQETLDFHQRVQEQFRLLALADPRRYLVLDATRPADVLATAIRDRVFPPETVLPDDLREGTSR